MPFVDFLGENAGMGEIVMKLPDQLAPFNQMAELILRGPSVFSMGERELIAAFVSASNNCSFCYGTHAATAALHGIDPELFTALIADIDSSALDDKLKPVLHYVKKLTQTPYKMVQADADAIYAAGWDESALTDAVLICGFFNMANRVVEGLGVKRDLPQEVLEESAKFLAENGYLPPDQLDTST
jgi:uncharacterized peroxidase-related enzyme